MGTPGKKHWIFSDGDLPPPGEKEPLGHEALMIVNLCKKTARIKADVIFEDKEPHRGITLNVEPQRVKCFRLDKPLGEEQYRIPYGQYALVLGSNVPITAVFGRLDVRQANMAYYAVQGYSY